MYPLRTLENPWFYDTFQGYTNRSLDYSRVIQGYTNTIIGLKKVRRCISLRKIDFILTLRLCSRKEDRVLLKFLVDQSQSLKHWRNMIMKCIEIYLLLLRMMALEQLARGNVNIVIVKSSRPEVFLRKGVLEICSKFTGEHPCLPFKKFTIFTGK